MVDAVGLELRVQRVPMSGLVGIEGRGLGCDACGDRDAFRFLLADERQRPALRGKFSAAFLLQCLEAIGSQQLHLD